MADKYSLVIVSNRLPVKVSRKNGKLEFEPSSGGLATAMSSLEGDKRMWVGWPGIPSDDLTATEKRQIATELRKYNCYPVHLTAEQVELFYEGYANDTLWPLFHYFQSIANYSSGYWDAYVQVNRLFAKAIKTCSNERASVWIHDYHLMVLPKMVRDILPNSSIGFFLHIPFPSFEIYRMLPERKEILDGLLGADLIGFHIYDYARHFQSSCLRLLGAQSYQGSLEYQGRMVRIDAFPIGIDYEKFRHALGESEVKEEIEGLQEMYRGQKLMISIDRLDYSKGIPERLEAFRLLLEQYPEYRGKVKLMMIAVPSRTEVESYQQLRDQIEQTVSRINGEFGTVDWAPISYQFQNRPFSEVVAIYNVADIALVTPIRDGMNLVAKEYVASQTKQSGVLILSEMAGAIDELPEALSINPNDTNSVVSAIVQALKMPKREKRRRLEAMQRRLRTNTVQVWGQDFLAELQNVATRRASKLQSAMTSAQQKSLVSHYTKAQSRLILLDYDGTLRPFVNTPNPFAARPSLRLKRMLKKLAEQDNTTLVIVSGRPKKTLERWFRGIPAFLAAEHGAWTRYGGQWTHTDVNFDVIKKKVRPIIERFVSRTAGSELEEKDYALVWHYRNVPPELAFVRSQELRRELTDALEDDAIGVFAGNMIIEIKPTDVNKGYVATEVEALCPADFILCAGDDYTDEDMFRQLPTDAYTIKIGNGETKARFRLDNEKTIIALLERLVKQ